MAQLIAKIQECDLKISIESALGSSMAGYLLRNTKDKNVFKKGALAVIMDFVDNPGFRYTKNNALIRYRIECNTVGTGKPCILLLDVYYFNPAFQ